MTNNEILLQLVEQVETRREQGQAIDLAEVCRDCPHMLAELQNALSCMDAADGFLAQDETEVRAPLAAEVYSDTLDRYVLGPEVARGGMGVILRVRDRVLHRSLALKVMREEFSRRPDLTERFVMEAQIAGQMQHPGVVPVHDLGALPDGRPFFAMKLVKGKTLAELLKERAAPDQDLPRFVRIFEQICQTMAFVHSKGVIHRDLKPANIMVGAFGEVQVMDWGLAKTLYAQEVPQEQKYEAPAASVVETTRGEDSGTAAGSVLGTPAYMPPEQACGNVAIVDERADVFALGAILCEILTGQPPYVGTAREVRALAELGQMQAARERLKTSGADRELVQMAECCLVADPGQRPRNAGEVARATADYLTGVQERLKQAELGKAAADARVEAEAKQRQAEQAKTAIERQRRKLAVALAAAAVVFVVLAGGAWTFWTSEQAERKLEQAQHLAQEQTKQDLARQNITMVLGQAEAARNELRQILRKPGGVFNLLNEPARWQAHIHMAQASLDQAKALLSPGARRDRPGPPAESSRSGIVVSR